MRTDFLKEKRRAFSLVEVTLAIGIVAFGIIALLGLLPSGLSLVRESSDESVGVNILTALASDLRNARSGSSTTRVYGIPIGIAGSGALYFDESGKSIGSTLSDAAIYKAAWSVRSRDVSRGVSPHVHLQIGWPARAPKPFGSVETVVLLNKNPAS